MLRLNIHGNSGERITCDSGDKCLWISGRDEQGHEASLFLSKEQAAQIVEKINSFWPEAMAGVQLEWLKEYQKNTMATIKSVFHAGFKPEPVPTSDVTEHASLEELAANTFGI